MKWTLPQIKKRLKNLEYDYKHLKHKTQKTGEAGIKRIKEGFPYFDCFDNVMGHRDNVDPARMAVQGTFFFADVEDQTDSSDVSVETVDDAPQKPPAGKRRSTATPPEKEEEDKSTEKPLKGGKKAKRRRRDEADNTPEGFQASFMEV